MPHDDLLKRLDKNLLALKSRSENLYSCLSLIDVNDCLDRLIPTKDSNYTARVTVNGSEKFINSS